MSINLVKLAIKTFFNIMFSFSKTKDELVMTYKVYLKPRKTTTFEGAFLQK